MKESGKKKFVTLCGYKVIKSILKIQDDDKMFQSLDELFGLPKNEAQEDTYESIVNRLRGGND